MASAGYNTIDGKLRHEDRRNQVMVGELPADFLRAGAPVSHMHMQGNEQVQKIWQSQQQAGFNVISNSNCIGRLSISVVQARLNKNYGLTKMDPYCRVRIGHTVFETPTAYNGAKSPRWNNTVSLYLASGIDSLTLEIFDERSFTLDNRIAWGHMKIPERVLKGGPGSTVDDWFPLSGKLGSEQEGSINLVFTIMPLVSVYTYTTPVPMMMPMYPPVLPPGSAPMMQCQRPAPYPLAQLQHGPLYTENDFKQVKDMFPNMEDDVVRSVMDANHGNKEATINSLLSMCSD